MLNIIRERRSSSNGSTGSDGPYIVKEGYIFYKMDSHNWKKCWFELKGSQLAYYSGPENKNASPLGVIEVLNSQIVPHSQIPTYRKNTFEIVNNEENKHFLSAVSEEERQSWVTLLAEVSASSRRNSATDQPVLPQLPSISRTSSREDPSFAPSNPEHDSLASAVASRLTLKFKTKELSVPLPPPSPENEQLSDSPFTHSDDSQQSTPNSQNSRSPVRLRRVSKTLSTSFGELPVDSQLVFDQQKKQVTAGTVDKLIEYLYDIENLDTNYQNTFLLTYRSFVAPMEVLQILMDSFLGLPFQDDSGIKSKAAKLRIRIYLKRWVNDSIEDFEEDQELVDEFVRFTTLIQQQVDPRLAHSLHKRLQAKLESNTQSSNVVCMFSIQPPRPIIPQAINSFEDIHPTEFARQLTLVESAIYRSIQAKELVGCGWSKEDKEKKSPNIVRMTEQLNKVSKWVAYEVVRATGKFRSQAYRRFVEIAEECRKLNNFHAVFEIVSGLQNAAVHRLKKTDDTLPNELKKNLDDLISLTNAQKSWKVYRETLRQSNPPCVPFIGVPQTDLTFLEDGNPTYLKNGLVNFSKCTMLGSVIKEIKEYQQTPYNLAPVVSIQEYLEKAQNNLNHMTMDDLYSLSLNLEPRTL